ncbi:hypothetical protein ABIB62_002740 [Mucilaginibacter sp. UYP25]|uniref:hypothetical protein n=1 Tax=unclassified Mucilaginibacter TaxID=2617802 RepID=UPI003399F1F0
MNKMYNIFLDNIKIGHTYFEKADAPMGCVFGKIYFLTIKSGYNFFRNYARNNNITTTDYPEDRMISTFNIPNLRILDTENNDIMGAPCYISGMDSDGFEIYIDGIAYPLYENEFPDHVKEYKQRF